MKKCESIDVTLTVEELSLDGEISLGSCSKSTAYRDVKRVNEYLEANKYDWRVTLKEDKDTNEYSLIVI